MKISLLILSSILLFCCSSNKPETKKELKAQAFFVGTYTKGESEGIYKCILNEDGTIKQLGLVAKTDNPSFLAFANDKKNLLAVNENAALGNFGAITSFQIDNDSLTFINKTSSGGAHPCFVAVNNKGYVATTNYTGGNVGLLKINKEGKLSELLDVQEHEGSGITARQKSPHPHSVWFEPGTNRVVSVDLGTNELWISEIDAAHNTFVPSNPYKIKMAPGAGPRHLTFHPIKKWMYVLNELNCTVSLLGKSEEGSYSIKSSISTLPEDYTEANTCADIHISDDGKFLYASNRGHNSIAIFSVSEKDGELSFIGTEPTHGETPRNFSLSPDDNFMVVANQNSNNIVSFKRDKNTGLLSYISEIKNPSPVCILFQ